jgi:hypothetical protein
MRTTSLKVTHRIFLSERVYFFLKKKRLKFGHLVYSRIRILALSLFGIMAGLVVSWCESVKAPMQMLTVCCPYRHRRRKTIFAKPKYEQVQKRIGMQYN